MSDENLEKDPDVQTGKRKLKVVWSVELEQKLEALMNPSGFKRKDQLPEIDFDE